MNTGEKVKRIGREFEVHESLGKTYYKCDRCANQYDSIPQAAACCAEPGEQKQVKKLGENIRLAERNRAKKALAAGDKAPVTREAGSKPPQKKVTYDALAKTPKDERIPLVDRGTVASSPEISDEESLLHVRSRLKRRVDCLLDAINAIDAALLYL